MGAPEEQRTAPQAGSANGAAQNGHSHTPVTITPGEEVAWHAIPDVAAVLKAVETSPEGLTEAEAAERLRTHGLNRLTPPKKASFLSKLWNQINNMLIWLLLAAAVVEGALQEWAEFGLILGVVAINASIGLIQEGKAEKAAEAIKAMLSSSADVFRSGHRKEVPADQLVPGDVVLLNPGDKVPADVRLLEINNFQVQESMLTGESLPVSKNLTPVDEKAPLGDRKCMAYSATNVSGGTAKGVVVATGDKAQIGLINKMVGEVTDMKTNLTKQLEILGRWIGLVVIVLAVLSFLLALLYTKVGFSEAFKSAVAISVAIIPEGLPALVTVTLAIGITAMARQKSIIRQLPAVETLGSLTVICTDKTGTITKNEMTVQAVCTTAATFKVSGVGYAPEGSFTTTSDAPLDPAQQALVRDIMEGALLCNDSALSKQPSKAAGGADVYSPVGAPTEVALLTAGAKAGLDLKELKLARPRLGAVPFDSSYKFMATVHQHGERRVMYVKGAPDRLIPLCASQAAGAAMDGASGEQQRQPLDAAFWQERQAEFSKQGLRMLALCSMDLPSEEDLAALTPESIKSRPPCLTLLALFAIMDPPRAEAIEAVRLAHKAGIVVKMITGDHALTAQAIGNQVGLTSKGSDVVYTGPEVDAMSDAELAAAVLRCNTYARASPENKIRIVRALQSHGLVVSMTGDGVNDAPALKAADVGVAMGITGTDVSKEAAKMVLADDNFASIVAAVKEGRRVWDNLKKVLLFNLPVAVAQGTCILWAYILALDNIPLNAIQVLYVNLVTAVTMGLMLAFEPAQADIMDRPPRPRSKRLFSKLVIWRTLFVSTIINVLILSMFFWEGRLGYSLPQRRATAMNLLVFAEISYSITCRFTYITSFHPRVFRGNPWCWAAALLTAALQMLVTYVPGLNGFFGMTGMDGLQWVRVLVCAVVVYAVVEVEKLVVDPVVLPYLRPFLTWWEDRVPGFLQVHKTPSQKERAATRKAAAHAVGDDKQPGLELPVQQRAAVPAAGPDGKVAIPYVPQA